MPAMYYFIASYLIGIVVMSATMFRRDTEADDQHADAPMWIGVVLVVFWPVTLVLWGIDSLVQRRR